MSDAAYLQADADDRRAALDAAMTVAAARLEVALIYGLPATQPHWLTLADSAYEWLRQRDTLTPVRIVLTGPVLVADQATPGQTQRSPDMPAVITDTQIATYPAAAAEDSKNVPLSDAVTLTDDDPSGAIATRTDNADGTTSYSANTPGVVNLTWTDGVLTLTDSLTVDPSAPAQIVVGPPVITDQAPPVPPVPPAPSA